MVLKGFAWFQNTCNSNIDFSFNATDNTVLQVFAPPICGVGLERQQVGGEKLCPGCSLSGFGSQRGPGGSVGIVSASRWHSNGTSTKKPLSPPCPPTCLVKKWLFVFSGNYSLMRPPVAPVMMLILTVPSLEVLGPCLLRRPDCQAAESAGFLAWQRCLRPTWLMCLGEP